jgi:hypothetical protein
MCRLRPLVLPTQGQRLLDCLRTKSHEHKDECWRDHSLNGCSQTPYVSDTGSCPNPSIRAGGRFTKQDQIRRQSSQSLPDRSLIAGAVPAPIAGSTNRCCRRRRCRCP